MQELIFGFLTTLIVCLVVIPCLCAGILWKAFQMAHVYRFAYRQCWKAQLAACCYAYLLLIGGHPLWRDSSALTGVRVVVFTATTTVAVPVLLRTYSKRSLVVGCLAVLAGDMAIASVFFWVFPQFS